MTKAKNILIIDDNPDDLEFYSELLAQSEKKYKVYTAETAEDGLQIFVKADIDCTFVDFNLPGKSGVELLDDINKRTTLQKAIVILTGQPHQKYQADAARKGALDYLVKDAYISPEQIDAVIEKVINWADEINTEGKA